MSRSSMLGADTTRWPFRTVALALVLAIVAFTQTGCSADTSLVDEAGDTRDGSADNANGSTLDGSAPDTTTPDPPPVGNQSGDEAEAQPSDPSGPGTTGPQGDSAVPGRQVPPLVLPTQPPGSDQAYDALIAQLDEFITDEQRTAGVPWPDVRSTDPVAAYRSCAEFQNWMGENNVTPWLVDAYTAPDSPERGWDVSLFAEMDALGILSTPSEPPYEMRVDGVVHPAATDITDALLAEVPDGSVAIVYWDSVGVTDHVLDDGTVVYTSPGWSDVGPWVAIMEPTEVGWQVWWDELTEVPPPGLDEDRGLPLTPPPRIGLS